MDLISTRPSLHPNARPSKTLVLSLQICLSVSFVFIFSMRFSAQTPNNVQPPPASTTSSYPSPPFPEAPQKTAAVAPSVGVPGIDQSQHIILPGDVLDISVFGAPDLSQKATVDSGGNIYMPLINYVHVAGLRVQDAQVAVEQAYFKIGALKFPHVGIVISSYSTGVVLLGEISKPGIYPIVGSGRLFDILAEAGGTTANSGQIVTISHKGSSELQTVFISNDPTRLVAANVPIQQADTIIVSKAGVIYVVGEVLAPNGFLMDEKGQYTVMKAVAMAHGLAKFSKASKARIVRRTPEGEQEIPIPLDKILVAQSPDIPMQSNDILFVPSSKVKIVAAKTAEIAVALATGLAYYGVYR